MTKVKKAPHAGKAGREREFIKVIHDLAGAQSHAQVFDDFLELAFCAIAKTTYPPGHERADMLEARYMAVVGRHDAEYIRAMPKLLGIAALAFAEGNAGDFLGRVSGELGALNKHLGQFFTPYEVSKLIAAAILTGCGEIIEREGFITVHEPTCGAGGMILAAADVFEGLGFDPSTQMFVQAVDVSATSFRMAYLQLSLRGIPADVIHGNALTLETFGAEITPAKLAFVGLHGERYRAWRSGEFAPAAPAEPAQLDLLGAL